MSSSNIRSKSVSKISVIGLQSAAKDRKTDKMASAPENAAKEVTEDPKIDLFEDDDEFEEFENEEWDDKEDEKEALQQWEDDWDDDDVNDDFSQQLRRELESNPDKK